MGKHSVLGTNLIKCNSQGKNKTSPEITQRFVDHILSEGLEGKIPPEGFQVFGRYKGKEYRINREGEILALNGEKINPFFLPRKRGLHVRIMQEKYINGECCSKEKELSVLSIMDKIFGPYLTGYHIKTSHPRNWILAPKDGNYNNIHWKNLEYLRKDEYRLHGTKRELLKTLLVMNPNYTRIDLMKLSGSSRAEIARAQEQLAKEGKLEKYNRIRIIRERYKINISEDSLLIYEILIQTNGSLSNSEIAKFLRKNDYTATSGKRSKQFFTNKIVRARKRLTDKGIIPRYNALFEEKREEAISLISQKPLTGATNKEIAEMLGLKEEQINNLVRQLKKEGKYVKP